ncbi:hypothetical protein PV05_05618 [Exophiala xenobiotica]|uniref:Uncharacterized protein n=1 Tax=Exophiala xenobiotica TaxID=348802 RepID=A0A0D2ENL6_9EURO|nr:uncharacterized protein PV05_05618 [Exophiala xenobiotica]KIW57013.1 hypothetical protein PV05_05618 [Exophiala xenobiotica]
MASLAADNELSAVIVNMTFLTLDDTRIWFDTTSIDSVMQGAPETAFIFTRTDTGQERVPSNKRTFGMAFGSPYTTEPSTAKKVVVGHPRQDDANVALSLKTSSLTTTCSEATSILKSTTLKSCLRKGNPPGSNARPSSIRPRKHVRFMDGTSLAS